MVIILILILIIVLLFLLQNRVNTFIGNYMLRDAIPQSICPKFNFIEKENKLKKSLETKPILRDVSELMFRTKSGENIYDKTQV